MDSGLAPGQFAAFYEGDECLGAGAMEVVGSCVGEAFATATTEFARAFGPEYSSDESGDGPATVSCTFRSRDAIYVQTVERVVCVGEFVRNAVVNLGIDPDTHNGVTRNVALRRDDGSVWTYDPHKSLRDAGIKGGEMFDVVEV